MPKAEDHQPTIVRRLLAEGWKNEGGKEHDKFTKAGRKPIFVPRHRWLSPGVARNIAKAAGWN
ncbi:type II toxin-antitoxin system HicA family toxin [Hansschlegelia beijingensis]|uniref:Type II toxin-antitoxin system HicA family toxin n=1 Tax=Hansschlegelia beijingensis TaxID=1133344 RepID=A0A7W6CX63_9HYPH|nr:type II toxin-antitoxin system HicA family toxin [Hansschlegelia beijingensis]MBB3972760.1 hypothetical protein [Hansschlegelia beijingensis]